VTELPKSSREPFFIESEGRRLFSIFHSPASRAPVHGGAVYFAPFAEEANRTRRMASLLADELGGAGTATLLFDYSSTGDSSGEFLQARWDEWISDGYAAISWLKQKTGKPVALVGLRLGAAVALECARIAGLDRPRIVLWQPVTNGRTYFTQFLRIRLAASLTSGKERETTKDLMDRLAGGETLEVAGYKIAPALAQAIDRLNLADFVPPPESKVHWFEVTTGDDKELMPPSRKAVSRWCESAVDVATSVVSSEQFWATQEIATAPPLIDATRIALSGPAA